MQISEILSYIIGVVGLLGVIFSIYNSFKNPQNEIETKQAVADKEIGNKASILAQKELESKALLLAQQVESEKVSNEKKFADMGVRIQAVDAKVDTLISGNNTWHLEISNSIVRLTTIIEERLAKK
jgi:hypothetical protein